MALYTMENLPFKNVTGKFVLQSSIFLLHVIFSLNETVIVNVINDGLL